MFISARTVIVVVGRFVELDSAFLLGLQFGSLVKVEYTFVLGVLGFCLPCEARLLIYVGTVVLSIALRS